MSDQMKESVDLEAFRQNWEQMRHVENQRLTFTLFYAAIVSGVLAFISQSSTGDYFTLFVILSVISFLGLVLCWRVSYSVELHNNNLRSLVISMTGLTKGKKEKAFELYAPLKPAHAKCYQICCIRILFIWLYFGLTIFFALLTVGTINIT